MNKITRVAFAIALIIGIVAIGFANASPRLLKQCNMVYWTDLDPTPYGVAGNQVSDFKLTLDGNPENFHYLDIKFIKPTFLEEGYYMFWLTPPTDPDFWAYWDAKGVNSAAPQWIDPPPPPVQLNWQWVMWRIVNGIVPMFALYSDGDGNYKLCDGLQRFTFGLSQATLRVNGDYPMGTYTFTCNAAVGPAPDYDDIEPNPLEGTVMNIEFR